MNGREDQKKKVQQKITLGSVATKNGKEDFCSYRNKYISFDVQVLLGKNGNLDCESIA